MSKGILMSAPSVLELNDGRKTQTRRIINPQPIDAQVYRWKGEKLYDGEARVLCWKQHVLGPIGWDGFQNRIDLWDGGQNRIDLAHLCPYGQPGDLLYVKEAWAQRLDMDHLNGTQLYDSGVRKAWYWADGPGRCFNTGCAGAAGRYRHARFMPRWASRTTLELTDVRVQRVQEISEEDAIHAPDAWERNDWVFALTFNVHKRNVLEMES